MIKLYFFYIAKEYSKNFIMILMGITLAISLIDYLQDAHKMVDASNQKILYLFYTWEFRVAQFYPLAIVFAATVTYMSLAKTNALVSLISFGYSKRVLFIPFVIPALISYLILIFLQTGEFSYAKERAHLSLNSSENTHIVDDLFFKYNDSFVYVKELNPIEKIIKGVTVFELSDRQVQSSVTLDKAKFDGEFWVADSAVITSKEYSNDGIMVGFSKKQTGEYKLLKGYKPKVIELIYEGKSLSLIDAISTYKLLQDQGLDSDKIKATFYYIVILPLFVFAMMVFIFFKTPYHMRYMNQQLVWALSLGGTLVIWGLLYVLYSLSLSGAILPEIGIVLPVGVFLLFALYIYLQSSISNAG